MNTEKHAAIPEITLQKNGARMPKSDIKPPIPGPIMNPVLIALINTLMLLLCFLMMLYQL